MKTSIALVLFLLFTSPVFAQQADVAETYTDAGMEERKGTADGCLNAVWRTPLATFGVHSRL